MGILNVTPDSFSDGGLYDDKSRAVEQGLRLVEEGADIVDIGGESTRPGSLGVSAEEEKKRVLPVIEELAKRTATPLSVDTVKPEVASAACAFGIQMLNDVSMLRHSTELASIAAEFGTDLVLMHSRKAPRDMQNDIQYNDVVKDVIAELKEAADLAISVGVKKEKIWLDPGIGFAKTALHSIELLARMRDIVALGFPVLVGPSRKSFIGKITGKTSGDRIGGTAAAVTAAILGGARAVRVHDVATMREASQIAHALKGFWHV